MKLLWTILFAATALGADRQYLVTTADDFGAGSLRAAIETVNAECTPADRCSISFAGPMTITPQSPLPAIEACTVILDGGVTDQTFTLPRPVVLSGERLAFGNGLELRPRCSTGGIEQHTFIDGLAIGSFPGNGILIATPPDAPAVNNVILANFIGTDATGTIARPNGLRGIALETATSHAEISSNVISGNACSGIAVWDGSGVALRNGSNVFIWGNRIGLSSRGTPLGNGASGVFVNAGAATIESNEIAWNRDFGVAMFPHSARVITDGNSLHDNGQLEIDWNLDLATSNAAAEELGIPVTPVLLDATYDPAKDQTVVHGALSGPTRGDTYITVVLFAGRPGPHPQAEQEVASVVAFSEIASENISIDVRFDATVKGDLRGKFVTGQTVTFLFNDFLPDSVSELSGAIPVR